MLPVSCHHTNDQPWTSRHRAPLSYQLKTNHVMPAQHLNQLDKDTASAGQDAPDMRHEASDSLKRLKGLEDRLVRVVEDMWVKSLRHIREMRSELRHVSQSLNEMREEGGVRRARDRRRSDLDLQCPSEFVRVGTWRSCYRFSNFETTWSSAQEYCGAFGANLVSLDSMKEAYVIDYLLKSNTAYEEIKGWWTSGQYAVRQQRWVWVRSQGGHTGDRAQTRPIEFSRWAAGEPNARSTMHCMILYKQDKYFWHDAPCSDKHFFICEIN